MSSRPLTLRGGQMGTSDLENVAHSLWAHAELKVDELKLAEGSGEAGAWLPLWQLSDSVPCVPLSLQRKLPADSRVLEASELVYTVSAQEYWQQAVLTEEETGNLYEYMYFYLTH